MLALHDNPDVDIVTSLQMKREGGEPLVDSGGEVTITIDASYAKGVGGTSAAERPVVEQNMAVRRLTPRECERLQGFPDDYTLINEKTADGPRYKALGNSMAVPVMRWIGERIQLCEEIETA